VKYAREQTFLREICQGTNLSKGNMPGNKPF